MSAVTRTRIYVSGPYSSDPEGGTARAIAAGQTLLDMGYAPFVPHLTHYWHTQHQANTYESWMQLDLAWVAASDAVLRMPGESAGADREVELAHDLGIPVFREVSALFRQVPVWGYTRSGDRFPIEPEPSSTVPPAVDRALQRVRSIFEKKNADYSDGRSWSSNFEDVAGQMGFERPQEVAETLIAVKQARLRSLRVRGSEPQNEAVEDTVLDRATYAVIRLALDIERADDKEIK